MAGTGHGTVVNSLPITKLTLYLQPTLDPVIEPDELALIVELGKRNDKNGLKPTDDGWIETIDINWCIAQGWQIKASKAASDYHFKNEGLEMHREQIIANCLKMVQEYKNKISITSVPIQNTLLRRAPYESQIWTDPNAIPIEEL